jgi:hypothetical protein
MGAEHELPEQQLVLTVQTSPLGQLPGSVCDHVPAAAGQREKSRQNTARATKPTRR